MRSDPFLLPHSLAQAAAADADQPAVIDGERSVSYAGLVDDVSRLAAALVAQGVTPGDRVLVHAAKSVETVVAIHGAQWAGAVPVPVDPGAPVATVADLAADAAPTALIGDQRTLGRAAALDIPLLVGPRRVEGARSITWDEVATHEPIAPARRLGDDPAYILYTSGSTGRPKGIVHSHRSGLRYARLAAETYGLSPEDRLASVAPFHFDQSTFELYASVVAHATTILVPGVLLSFPAEVSALVARSGATVWYSVPTLLVQLIERGALDRHDLSGIRWVLFGGEVFPTEALAALMEMLPAARFSNVYGPTEVNQCTYHHLDRVPTPGERVPIGEPWGDTEVRLVDQDGGVLAEPGRGVLEVRTSTMMLGYWRRPDLTARAIEVVRTADGLPQRWYRTGDLVERDEAGTLHFLGRVDRQVKLRGHRIELEGVEAVLDDAPGVVRSVVVVSERDGVPALVGLLEGSDVDVHATLRHLRQVLPPYAVPAELVALAALPRTTTGKVDALAAAALAAQTVEPVDAEQVEERRVGA